MRIIRLLAPIIAALGLTAGCSSPSSTAAAASTSPAAAAQAAAAAPSSAAAAPMDAQQVVRVLTTRVSSAKPSIVFTATSDPNHLLGRQGEYTSKAAFADSRIPATAIHDGTPGNVALGGCVEVFASAADAQARVAYIHSVTRSMPMLADGYDYTNGPVLVRVSSGLTPDQAAQYQAALKTIR